MAKIEIKLRYKKKVGDFDFIWADVGISEIDTEIPLETQLAPAREYLDGLWELAKDDINNQYKEQQEGIGK